MATYDFARLADIKRIAGDRFDDVVSGVLFDLSAKVIRETPVGDPTYWQSPAPPGYSGGTAKGNWQPTIGQPATAELSRVDPTGSAPLAELAPMTEAAPGNVFYLTNNVPYITRLEYGYSAQAPAGMVRRNLAQLDKDIKEQIAQLPR